jgi:dCMP deaminase
MSYGYNGMPNGFDNNCETNNETNNEVLHAESNAIAKVCKSTQSSEGSSLYVTTSPCFDCAKLIIQSGIICVYYKTIYRKDDGIKLLQKANIKTFHLV